MDLVPDNGLGGGERLPGRSCVEATSHTDPLLGFVQSVAGEHCGGEGPITHSWEMAQVCRMPKGALTEGPRRMGWSQGPCIQRGKRHPPSPPTPNVLT